MAGKRDAPKRTQAVSSPKAKTSQPKQATTQSKPKAEKSVNLGTGENTIITPSGGGNVGLTVRIEINLPANGTQETYDNIFQSIRKNLLNGNV